MTASSSFRALGFGAAVLLVGCGFGHEMERAVVGPSGRCPAGAAGRTDAVPDTTELRWYRATEERDLRLSAEWCSIVGDPVMSLRAGSDFAAWEVEDDLQIVSWNMQAGGGDLYGFLRDELGVDCSASGARVRAGAGPFVLLLQEAWRRDADLPPVTGGRNVPWTIDPDGRDEGGIDVVEAADQCGLAYVYVPSARNGTDNGSRPKEDMGIAVLSSVTLSTPIAIDLPVEGGRKVGVAATVRSPVGARVRVATTHLDVASTLVRTLLSGNQTRARQADGFIEALDQAERDGPLTGIAVVGGDFNTWSNNETALKLMREAFPDSPQWDGLGTRGSFPADHMFFRRGSFINFHVDGYERVDNLHGSDHHARRLTLRVTSPQVP